MLRPAGREMIHLQLTDHFHSTEFFVSDTEPEIAKRMELTESVARNLYLWCYLIGEPIRRQFGVVQITSGYRNDELNAKIGGANYSQHLRGLAADFICPQVGSMPNVHMWTVDHLRDSFSQAFYYPQRGHCHVGCPELGVMKQIGYL